MGISAVEEVDTEIGCPLQQGNTAGPILERAEIAGLTRQSHGAVSEAVHDQIPADLEAVRDVGLGEFGVVEHGSSSSACVAAPDHRAALEEQDAHW
ncbi:MAG: hypothetical protein AAGE90_00940 [Pseudomonadota bacterium]